MPRLRRCSLGFAAALTVFAVICSSNTPVLSAPQDHFGHWAEEALVCCQVMGLLKGYPDGTIRPDAVVPRDEMAAMVCRAIGEEENARAAGRLLPVFPDVPSLHWASGYVRVCFEAGILLGDSEGMMLPSKAVTRAEAAAVFVRTAGFLGIHKQDDTQPQFVDSASIPEWAVDEIQQAVSLGLMRGDDKGAFRPSDGMTRAEAITVLVRLLELQGSRWDLCGVVVSLDGERSSFVVEVSGEEIPLKVARDTRIYRGGVPVPLSAFRPGDTVKVLLHRETPIVAALMSTE